jgi:hypothetical protein
MRPVRVKGVSRALFHAVCHAVLGFGVGSIFSRMNEMTGISEFHLFFCLQFG